jgi:glycosyltransferase involved in cell wall biosynthesis
LFSALKGYADHGYAVTVIAFCDLKKKHLSPYPGVTVKRAASIRLWKGLRALKHRLRWAQSVAASSERQTSAGLARVRGYPALYHWWCKFGLIEGLWACLAGKPDLIYGYEYSSVWPASLLGRWFRVPVVSRFQGTELGFFIDDEVGFSANDLLIKGTQIQTDMVVMGNDGTSGDKVLERLGIRKDSVRFWVNGITAKEQLLRFERDADYATQMGLPADAFIVTTANRFVDWKRIDRIVIAMAEVIKERPRAYLVAVGGGPEGDTLKELARQLGIVEHVLFPGIRPHDETVRHIANSHLYVTLNHSGNLGNSILEALALGVPVLTLRNGSVEHVLTHRYNAILVDDHAMNTIPANVIELIDAPSLRAELSRNARSYARDKLLSWDERMALEVSEAEKLREVRVTAKKKREAAPAS